MTDHLTLYVKAPDHPQSDSTGFRKATPEEIRQVAQEYVELLESLLTEECTPIPVKITWAGRNQIETELHARDFCAHIWERGEPRVHLDTTTSIYLIGVGNPIRGALK